MIIHGGMVTDHPLGEGAHILIKGSTAAMTRKSLFVLREIEGLSVDEKSAEALQIPAATVKTRFDPLELAPAC